MKYICSLVNILVLSVCLLIISDLSFAQEDKCLFTQKDRDRLLKVELRIDQLENSLENSFDRIDTRLENLRDLIVSHYRPYLGFDYDSSWAYLPGKVEYKVVDKKSKLTKDELSNLLNELRVLADHNNELANILRKYNLY